MTNVIIKFLSSHKDHKVAITYISLAPQPDTCLHYQTMDTGLVHRMVWLFMLSKLSPILIVPTDGGN